MGTHRPSVGSRRSAALRPALVLMGSAVCAAVAATAPAFADSPPPAAFTLADVTDPGAAPFGAPPLELPRPEALGETVTRIVTQAFGMPPEPFAPVESAAPVADETPQVDQIKVGSIEIGRPSVVTPEQAEQVNSGAAEVQNGLSDVLTSSGVDPARSDEVAEQVMGDTLIGAAIGGVVIAPVAATVGAVVGGVGGFVLGIPFLPTGLVIGPVVGATMVAAFIAAPAVVTGAVIGAGVGAVNGWNAPLDPPQAG